MGSLLGHVRRKKLEDSWKDAPAPVRDAEISYMFHVLWTKAVHQDGYDKKEWMKLQELLLKKGIAT
jgi:hypothetical protein